MEGGDVSPSTLESRMEGGDVSPPCALSLCANQQRGGIDGHQDRIAGT